MINLIGKDTFVWKKVSPLYFCADYVRKYFSRQIFEERDVFEESLKSGDCVKILVNCMQNIEKQVK